MKKRNQIVSALLTGVLLGGTATASVTSVSPEAAEEGQAAAFSTDTAEDESEGEDSGEAESNPAGDGSGTETEDNTPVSEETSSAGQSEDGAEGMPSAFDEGSSGDVQASLEEGTESLPPADGADASAYGDEELLDSVEESFEESADTGTDEESTDSAGSGGEASGEELEAVEDGEGSEEENAPGPEAGEADGENPVAGETGEEAEESGEEENPGEEKEEKVESGTEVRLDEPIPYKTPEQISAEEMAKQIAMRKAAELERKREETETIRAEAQEAEAKAKKAELEAQAARRYSYAGASRAYYSGTYFVTSAQKRLALNVGFKTVEKRPAMAAGGETVNIREAKSDGARVIGILDGKDVCYLLTDENDGSGWVYVESGEVRGFVPASSLQSGADVSEYVSETGENAVTTAEQLVDPLENTAYRFSLNTTKDVASIIQALGTATVNRQAMLSFGLQFLGNPYVWGGESLTTGCDCSGFTQQVYAQFGISLPRTSYEQAEVGVKIPAEEALPGDLLFYARDGVVYHVLMYMGDGKAVNASSSATGIIVSDVDYGKVCWGCRYISDSGAVSASVAPEISSTQASALQAIGQMAYEGDAAAQEAIIEALAQASLKEWKTYGFCRSVIIAQAIEESGWLSFGSSAAGIQATDNNILGMNEDLNNSTWASPWGGKAATRLVPQYAGGENVYNFESMRLYDDMEGCMEDYAAFKVGLHPDLIGETDVDHVIAVGLKGYATNPNYQSNIRSLIDRFNLTRFDKEETAAVRLELPEETTDDVEVLVLPEELVYGEEAAAPTDGFVDENETAESSMDGTEAEGNTENAENGETSSNEPGVLTIEENAKEDASTGTEDDESGVEILYTWVDVESDSDEEERDILLETVVAPSELDEDGDAEEEEEAPKAPKVPKAPEVPEFVPEKANVVPPSDGPYEEGTEEEPGTPSGEEGEPEAPAGGEGEPETPLSAAEQGHSPYAGEGEGAENTAEDPDLSEEQPLKPKTRDAGNSGNVFETTARSASGVRLDLTDYTEDQMELIWAVVAQEDDTSYDGALAVISSVMNRADVNYGGFGNTAFDQLTAESQYACSADVEDPLYYERRLNGNVPDFVKQAVTDCLKNGIRNNAYTSFRPADYIDGSVQIGANYYFFETAGNAAEAIRNMSDVIGEAAEEVESTAEVVPDGIYDQEDLPDAYYLPNDFVEEAGEEAEVLYVGEPEDEGDEAEEVFYSGIDDEGYVLLNAVPDFDR